MNKENQSFQTINSYNHTVKERNIENQSFQTINTHIPEHLKNSYHTVKEKKSENQSFQTVNNHNPENQNKNDSELTPTWFSQ